MRRGALRTTCNFSVLTRRTLHPCPRSVHCDDRRKHSAHICHLVGQYIPGGTGSPLFGKDAKRKDRMYRMQCIATQTTVAMGTIRLKFVDEKPTITYKLPLWYLRHFECYPSLCYFQLLAGSRKNVVLSIASFSYFHSSQYQCHASHFFVVKASQYNNNSMQ